MFEHAWLHTAPHIDRLSCLSTRALSDFCLQEISNNSLDSSGASSADVATINAAARSDIKGCSNRQRIQTATKAAKTAKQGPLSSTMTKTAGADKGHNQRQKAASTDKGHKEHNNNARLLQDIFLNDRRKSRTPAWLPRNRPSQTRWETPRKHELHDAARQELREALAQLRSYNACVLAAFEATQLQHLTNRHGRSLGLEDWPLRLETHGE